jgi:hypothetical protein
MNTEILKTLNLPTSYLTQDDAFKFGKGDNFFPLPDGTMICISENDPLFMELSNAGFKTLLELHIEKYNL